jgi:hypothetical protein
MAVDTDRYPLGDPEAMAPVVAAARDGLARHGVAILDGFLRPEAVSAICDESRALEPSANHAITLGSPYLGLPDESFPLGHPRRAEVRSSLAAVAYDLIGADSLLRAIYEWDVLLDAVSEMLDRRPLYRYADPFGALNLAVMADGDELGWHFDQTDFVVSIALQSAEHGGEFESATRVRAVDDECFDAVTAVLDGDRRAVTSVPMRPGTLMLFEGRRSLHRVTPISGPRPRYVALLAYDTKPDTDSSELLKLVRYGRLP